MNHLTTKEYHPVSATTEKTSTLADTAEGQRITKVIHDAADMAFQARVRHAMTHPLNKHRPGALEQSKRAAGIDDDRWRALCTSTREAQSPTEFRAFARVLQVSPQWLAVGTAGFHAPPVGWHTFGTHVDQPYLKIEFSERLDNDGLPLWERVLE